MCVGGGGGGEGGEGRVERWGCLREGKEGIER